MLPLPLTRAANLCDFDGICASVAQWQLAFGVDAYQRWREARTGRVVSVCVNWSASPFDLPDPITEYRDGIASGWTIECTQVHAIVALCVLDRVDRPLTVLKHYASVLSPGGLLVATFALWDACGPDVAIGHELRCRIYDRISWRELLQTGRTLGLKPFGGVDLRYPGDTLGDHTLGTITLIKEAP